jgi:hypothetical protein
MIEGRTIIRENIFLPSFLHPWFSCRSLSRGRRIFSGRREKKLKYVGGADVPVYF